MRRQPSAVSRLRSALGMSIGPRSALAELKWMQDAALAQRPNEQESSNALLRDMVRRRIKGEPLQYILGTQPFGPLDIITRPPTLIPRPETEEWVHRLAARFSPTSEAPISVLDLCTGTGCIPLLLCHLWLPHSTRAVGVDLSASAISLARENASANGSNGSVLRFIQADILDEGFADALPPSDPPYTLLTCNPPYISEESYNALPSSVRLYEDPLALRGDPPGAGASSARDGLSFYRRIARLLPRLVPKDAMVVFEHGEDQGDEVRRILGSEGVGRLESWKDQFGRDRVCAGWTK